MEGEGEASKTTTNPLWTRGLRCRSPRTKGPKFPGVRVLSDLVLGRMRSRKGTSQVPPPPPRRLRWSSLRARWVRPDFGPNPPLSPRGLSPVSVQAEVGTVGEKDVTTKVPVRNRGSDGPGSTEVRHPSLHSSHLSPVTERWGTGVIPLLLSYS